MTRVNSEANEWVPANITLATLTEGGRSPADVKAMLAEYLRDGNIRAQAEAVWISSEPKLGEAWKSDTATSDVERDFEVPAKYWRTDKRALDDRARWRWPYNKFFYTVNLKPLRRRMFRGVKFNIFDLSKLQQDVFTVKAKTRRGPPPDVAARDAGWLQVVRLAIAGQLNHKTLESQGELQLQIKENLNMQRQTLGKNQIYEIARMVYPLIEKQKLISGVNPEL